MKIKFYVAIFAFFISGCAFEPAPSIHDVDPQNLTEDQSIILASTGASETCSVHASSVVIKEYEKEPVLIQGIGVMPINNSFVDSMFDDEYGRVFSLLLSPGKYDFWLDSTHPWLQYDSPLFTKPITLKPKEIKYVGEFYANGCLNISLTIRDNSLRDINKIKSLEPNLNEEKVNIDIVELLDR